MLLVSTQGYPMPLLHCGIAFSFAGLSAILMTSYEVYAYLN